MYTDSDDFRLRLSDAVDGAAELSGGTLPREMLEAFPFEGERIRLLDTGRGIRNVDGWPHTLSITTFESGRYEDREAGVGEWIYPYETRSRDGSTGLSNAKLSAAGRDGVSILYFYKPSRLDFIPMGLVRVVRDDEVSREFRIARTALPHPLEDPTPSGAEARDIRRWVSSDVKRRYHQPVFAASVYRAYSSRCVVCNATFPDLIDAAHIISDREPDGHAIVQNGLALCKLHHVAYDKRILGVDPDGRVVVHDACNAATAGALLTGGFTRFAGQTIADPRHADERPHRWRLERKYDEFRANPPRLSR